jgi:exosortase
MSTRPLTESVAVPATSRTTLRWAQILWFALLVLVCYWPTIAQLVRIWAGDDDMGHGFFVPLVAGFIVWQRREELTAEPPRSNKWGLAVIAWGAIQSILATLAAELFTQRLAIVITLTGIVLYIGGKRWLKLLAFPLFLLIFMIPIPAILYAQLTLRLQEMATVMAEWLLSTIGIPVLREGNLLKLPSQTLNVAEACSGIRSLLSLSFLSLVYGYFRDRRGWVRTLLFFLTIPIAIGANGLRVMFTGILSEMNTAWASGFYHEVEGYLVFVVALASLLAFHSLVNFCANQIAKRSGKDTVSA